MSTPLGEQVGETLKAPHPAMQGLVLEYRLMKNGLGEYRVQARVILNGDASPVWGGVTRGNVYYTLLERTPNAHDAAIAGWLKGLDITLELWSKKGEECGY